jgi:4-hydroxy-3-polyprenylbenzoate decarboxylase
MHAIHLRHLADLSTMGVRVVPAMPGFYHKPQTLMDLVDMMK